MRMQVPARKAAGRNLQQTISSIKQQQSAAKQHRKGIRNNSTSINMKGGKERQQQKGSAADGLSRQALLLQLKVSGQQSAASWIP